MTTPTTTLRAARPDDLAALDALLARSYPALLKHDYPPSVMVTALPIIARAQPDLLASGTYFVVETPEAIVAAGGWTMQAPGGRPGKRGVGHIRHVATDPDHLRRGHAAAIMEQIKFTAFASGMMQLDCLSTRTAVPFYTAMGFRPVAELDIQLRPGIVFPSVQMTADTQTLSDPRFR